MLRTAAVVGDGEDRGSESSVVDGKGCGFRKGVEGVKESVWVYIDDLYRHDVAISCMSLLALSLFNGDVWHGVTALPSAASSQASSSLLLLCSWPSIGFVFVKILQTLHSNSSQTVYKTCR